MAPFSCTYGGAHDPDTGAQIRSGGLPDFAVDGNKVYAAWEDAVPAAPTIGRILFSQSSDGGQTWSAPVVISHTPAGIDAFVPTIAVNSGHTIGVSYYDFRANTPAPGADTDVWLVALRIRLHERGAVVRGAGCRTVRYGAGAGCGRLVRRRLRGHDHERDGLPAILHPGGVRAVEPDGCVLQLDPVNA